MDRATNDKEIAEEILAALIAGKQGTVLSYARKCLSSEIPAVVARGLTVCGFLNPSEDAEALLHSHKDAKGFIGKAYSEATYAYERNKWARHWFGLMCAASESAEFWRYSILFLKVVDGRFDTWEGEFERSGVARRFEATLSNAIPNRIKRRPGERERTLVGDRVPDPVFVIG